jgi:outer membrane protein assembly factor BamB
MTAIRVGTILLALLAVAAGAFPVVAPASGQGRSPIIAGGTPMPSVAAALAPRAAAGASETPAPASAEKALAQQILQTTGVRGGLVVHVGCGDGRLTAALHAGDAYLVHGLDADAANVEKAREHIRPLGLYGPVSADQLTGDRLPYVDNLVNLVVAQDLGKVPMTEVLRVLVPEGVAYVKGEDGAWAKTVKPRPKEIDEWTHYLHDATGNAVAHDAVVGPPRQLQWVGNPQWARHHDHMASMSALVSAGGRIFYIMDEGPKETILLPSVWSLVARDAFSGVVLWKRPIQTWCTQLWPLKSGPNQLPRRLLTDGKKVYVTLGIDAPVSALDAATGETLRTYKETPFAEELILSQGVLFVQCTRGPTRLNDYRPKFTDIWANCRPAEGAWDKQARILHAIDAESGRALWTREFVIAPLTLAADAKRLYFFSGERVVSADRKTGAPLWQSEPVKCAPSLSPAYGPSLVVYGDVVLLSAESKNMHGFDAATGRRLWSAPHLPGGHTSPEDLLVVQGLVWCGVRNVTGRDLHTGEVKGEAPPDATSYWFHHRCHRAKATDRYILLSRTGIEFVEPAAKHWINNNWVRGGCLYGVMPCNGLVYAPPSACGCYLEGKLYGFNALAPQSKTWTPPREVPDAGRMERGPAYEQFVNPPATADLRQSAIPSAQAEDWPTYRHDPARSGASAAAVPPDLKAKWQVQLGGRLTGPTVAGGRAFVASVDTHTVYAIDADSGKPVWRYTAGGRVDSPPTVQGGLAIFGSADGWIYAVRASDGALAWRFRAAPVDRRIMAFEQLESAWPVSGSVLVLNGTVWAVAGRSAFLDGGLRLLRLDARTGRKLSETIVDYGDPEASRQLHEKLKGCTDMPVALPDILSSDGRNVYMRSQPFDLNGGIKDTTPQRANDQVGPDAHLFSRTGFLDNTWFSRSYWLYGRGIVGLHAYPAGFEQWCEPAWYAPSGRLLVFNADTVFGFGRQPAFQVNSAAYEYRFFAAARAPSPEEYQKAIANVTEKGKPKPYHSDWKLRQGLAPNQLSAADYRWSVDKPPLEAKALVLAGDLVFAAGPPELLDQTRAFFHLDDPATKDALAAEAAALAGKKGARLWAISARDGKKVAEVPLESPPVFDGMAAAGGRLYVTTMDGKVLCLGKPK